MAVSIQCKWSMGKKRRTSLLKKRRLVISLCFLGKSFNFDNKWSYFRVWRLFFNVFVYRKSGGRISVSVHWQIINRCIYLYAGPTYLHLPLLHIVTLAQDSSSYWFCSRNFLFPLDSSFFFPSLVPRFPVTYYGLLVCPWAWCCPSPSNTSPSAFLPFPLWGFSVYFLCPSLSLLCPSWPAANWLSWNHQETHVPVDYSQQLAGCTLELILISRSIHSNRFLSFPALDGRDGALALLEGERLKIETTCVVRDS